MAKELPYFKFEYSEWNDGSIQGCSYEAQGLFINICSIYWSRLGELTEKFILNRLSKCNANALQELYKEKVLHIQDGVISIKFLDEQLSEFSEKSIKRSKAAKIRWGKSYEKQEVNANALQVQSKSNAIIEKRREDKNNTDAIAPDGVTFSSRCSRFISHFNKLKGDKVNSDNKPTGYRINDKVKRSLKARIKDGYSADDISTALTNALQDSYHVETNGKYITPEFILRADKLEKYLNSPISKKPVGQDDYLARLPEDRRQAYMMAKLHGA